MQVLRLLSARRLRRAVSTITAAADGGEDEGPFFDLDLSAPASSADSQATESGSESGDSACAEPDFVISLQRSRSASPSYERLFFGGGAPIKFCASEPSEPGARRGALRALSFGSFHAGRDSCSRSTSSARYARLFGVAYRYGHGYVYGSPAQDGEAEASRGAPGDVIKRYLRKISRRLRRVRPVAAVEMKALRLRKCRSASASAAAARSPPPPPPTHTRRDDSLLEKQDGIASAIAHCKESLHRASVSVCDSPLVRSRSDPGKL